MGKSRKKQEKEAGEQEIEAHKQEIEARRQERKARKQEKAEESRRKEKTIIIDTTDDNRDENDDETDTNDGGDSGESEGIRQVYTPAEQIGLKPDNYDVLYNIKDQLQAKGIDISGDLRFMIYKKDERGKYPHLKTFFSELPDMDYLGENYGGGDYMLRVWSGITKNIVEQYAFSISLVSYPEKKLNLNNSAPATPVNVYQPQNNTGLEKLIEGQGILINTLMAGLINKKEPSMLEMLKVLKDLAPEPVKQQQIPYQEMFAMAGEMFKTGVKLREDIAQGEGEEDMGDVIIQAIKKMMNGFSPEAIQSLMNKNTPPSPALPTASTSTAVPQLTAKQKEKQVIDTLTDFFEDVTAGFNSELEINPYVYAEKCKHIKKYVVIENFVKKFDDVFIITMLQQYNKDVAQMLLQPEFKDYLLTVIDIIRNFDIITLDDDGNIIKTPVVKEDVSGERIEPEPSATEKLDNVPVTEENSGSDSEGNNQG